MLVFLNLSSLFFFFAMRQKTFACDPNICISQEDRSQEAQTNGSQVRRKNWKNAGVKEGVLTLQLRATWYSSSDVWQQIMC